MQLRSFIIGGSLVLHGVLVLALGKIHAPEAHAATSIEVFETTKAAPPPPPPPPIVEEPPAPKQPAVTKAAPAPAPVPAQADPSPAPLAALPDLGLELSGATGGNGVAAAPNKPAPAPPTASSAPKPKTLEKPAAPKDACDDPPAKPKLINLPRPTYTEAARAANVEGKVRVELTVDETGKVIDVKALTTLGHGLDESALTAARGATFEPAVRCGKPSRSTFTLAIRFTAG